MKKTFYAVAVCATLLAASSCTHRLIDFTLISSKNVDLAKGASFVRGKERVKGVDKVHVVLFIPTGSINLKEAVDRAIETTPGAIALLDGVVYTKFWYVPLIYGQSMAIVEGTPLIDPSLVLNKDKDDSPYKKVVLSKSGEIESVETLTSEAFISIKEKIQKKSHLEGVAVLEID
ncbi:MAG: hypothetical protein RQ735_11175 [Flavobacteriaceae bacterium]|nr:hypothetical protein [Flavobacteriaceae bacterium]